MVTAHCQHLRDFRPTAWYSTGCSAFFMFIMAAASSATSVSTFTADVATADSNAIAAAVESIAALAAVKIIPRPGIKVH